MAAKKKSPAFELAKSMLQKNADVPYADVKASADRKGIPMFPIVFGRAKSALGLVEGGGTPGRKKKAGRKKMAKRVATPGRRGPGRPRKNPAPVSAMGGLDDVIAAMKANESDRERYHGTLVKIRDLIDSVL